MTVSATQLPSSILKADSSGELSRRLTEFRDSISAAAGTNLISLVVFGGVARGRYKPGLSDVNVLVVLNDAGTPRLKQIAPALRTGFRAIRLEAMILTRSEIPAIGGTFPTKLLDIKEHHVLLAGEDVLSCVEVARDRMLIRIEQELRNLALRLRVRAAMSIDDPAVLIAYLATTARSIAIEFTSLLRAASVQVPEEDRTAAIFEESARAFGLNARALSELAAIRNDRTAPTDLAATVDGILAALEVAAGTAASMNRKDPQTAR